MKQKESELFLFMAFGFLFIGTDVSIGHLSAGLHHDAMWWPLILAPVGMFVSLARAVSAREVVKKIFFWTCWLAVIVGMTGVYFHCLSFLRGLKGQVAWEVFVRLMRYPPLLAPLAVSGLGALGLLIRRMETKQS